MKSDLRPEHLAPGPYTYLRQTDGELSGWILSGEPGVGAAACAAGSCARDGRALCHSHVMVYPLNLNRTAWPLGLDPLKPENLTNSLLGSGIQVQFRVDPL